MDTAQYIVAIEIGSSKIVGALAELMPNGQLRIIDIESVQTLNYVRYGCIQNVSSTKNTINIILSKLESQINGKIKSAFVGVSGRSLHSISTDAQSTSDIERAITQATLDKIKVEVKNTIFDNFDVIDAIAHSYTVDKAETNNPVGTFGKVINARYNLVLAKKNILTNIKRVFDYQHNIQDIIITPVAVADAVLTDDERTLGCMLVDLGAETSTISIYRNGALNYLNTLPLGGRNITRDITALGITEENAEKIKKNIAQPLKPAADPVTIDGIKSSDAANYILARTGEINANIVEQITRAGLQISDIRSIVLVGGGAQLKGVDHELADLTKVPVRIANSIPSGISYYGANAAPVINMGVFALLKAAAHKIGADSCVYIERFIPTPTPEPEPEPIETPEEEKPKPRKSSFLGNLRDRVVNIFTDDDNDKDNYNN